MGGVLSLGGQREIWGLCLILCLGPGPGRGRVRERRGLALTRASVIWLGCR